jgi:dimethylamine/trimethylamine dehydrogenase
MTTETLAEFGADHVVMATGSKWRRDGTARHHTKPIPINAAADILTPDDILDGKRPKGKNVVLYDDDHYYMGGVIAELLRRTYG